MNIKYKIVEVKEGDGPYIPYTDQMKDRQAQEESATHELTSATENLHNRASSNANLILETEPRIEKRRVKFIFYEIIHPATNLQFLLVCSRLLTVFVCIYFNFF